MLGSDYEMFISNFDVFGEFYLILGGGLFVEGWFNDFYLENVLVLVVEFDGKIYMVWVVFELDVIYYQLFDYSQVVNVDIQ